MSEINSNVSTERSSEKSFGVVFAIIFLIVALYPLLINQEIRIWSIFVSLILISLAYFSPKALRIPNKIWFKFGIFLGSIIAPLVMLIVYLITVLPTGLIMRFLGKDLLKQKLDKNAKSYWVVRTKSVGPMKNQF